MDTKTPRPVEIPAAEPIEAASNAFARLLQEFHDGDSLAELSENLQTLVASVKETKQQGKLIYTLTIRPSGNAIVVTDKIELKEPKDEREAAIFFATEQNTLQREDPNQRKLDLREVKRPAQEMREVTPPPSILRSENQAAV